MLEKFVFWLKTDQNKQKKNKYQYIIEIILNLINLAIKK